MPYVCSRDDAGSGAFHFWRRGNFRFAAGAASAPARHSFLLRHFPMPCFQHRIGICAPAAGCIRQRHQRQRRKAGARRRSRVGIAASGRMRTSVWATGSAQLPGYRCVARAGARCQHRSRDRAAHRAAVRQSVDSGGLRRHHGCAQESLDPEVRVLGTDAARSGGSSVSGTRGRRPLPRLGSAFVFKCLRSRARCRACLRRRFRQLLAGTIGDLAALASKYRKPLSARLFPIVGKKAGDRVRFDNPHLVDAMVMPLGRG